MSSLPGERFYGKSVIEMIGKSQEELDNLHAKLLNIPLPQPPIRKWSKTTQRNFVRELSWGR